MTWNEIDKRNLRFQIFNVDYANSKNITVVGSGGNIYHSTDDGQTWNSQSNGVTNSLYNVAFYNDEIGSIVGINGIILHTSSGGIAFINDKNTSHPNDFILKQNYPNPFNPITTIEYSIPKQSNVTIKVYDILGREVATLVNEEKPVGNYKVKFDGSGLSSGIYFYRMVAGGYSETKKLVFLK